jgi:hypothetical protein
MRYSECNNILKSVFSPEVKEMIIPGSRVRIRNQLFFSEDPETGFLNSHDLSVPENRSFSYPIFVPSDKESRNVILLLHGLNERSWLKYLAWAHFLSENTGSYVILFPISFHINRSPESWRDPRIMAQLAHDRISTSQNLQMSSFANAALSKRLTDDPGRFFFSGYRTAVDITNLLKSVRDGNHEIIPATSSLNIFSYSIGAFLAEIMMIANPKNLFSRTKMFVFCGGSVFSRMHGTSKLIMDSLAFNTLYKYFMDDFESSINEKNPQMKFFMNNNLGLAFRSMIDLNRLKGYREKILREMRERLSAISLVKDRVIPPVGIVETLDCFNAGRVVEVADFPYEYSHENPFPVSVNEAIIKKVDDCFDMVMAKAAEFLS